MQEAYPIKLFHKAAKFTGSQTFYYSKENVKVEIIDINHETGTLYGTIKLFSGKMTDPKNLLRETDFTGEIIDGRNFVFRSALDRRTNDIDEIRHWAFFGGEHIPYVIEAMDHEGDNLNYQALVLRTGSVFMRWTPDKDYDTGATPATGFYYAVMNETESSLKAVLKKETSRGVSTLGSIEATYVLEKSFGTWEFT